jgi:hypothetical protein
MRRIPLILAATMLVSTVSAHAQSDSTAIAIVAQREADMWSYVKAKTLAPFRALIDTTAYTGLYYDGRRGSALDVANYHWTDLESYALSEMIAREIDSTTVLVTYKAVLKGRSVGVRVQGPYWMATLWHKRGDNWLVVFHSEVKGPR